MKHSNFPGRRPASILLACASLLLAACGGGGGSDNGGGGGGGGNQKPTASIVFPPMEAIFTGDVLTVRGTASDDGDVDSVTVNGVAATSSDGFATWTAKVSLANGANELVVAVEDDDGETTASAASVNVTRVAPLLGSPTGIKVDAAKNRALVLDSARHALFSVDLDSGERSVISSALRGAGPIMPGPLNLDINEAATVAYVADTNLPGVFAIDLATGNRTVISSASLGEGPAFGVVRDLAFDGDGNRIFAISSNSGGGSWSILSVNIDTGERQEVVTVEIIDPNPPMHTPMAIEWDAFNTRIVVASSWGELVTVAPDTGTITPVFDSDTATDVGLIYDIALADNGQTAFVLGGDENVWMANLTDGSVALVSGETRGTGQAVVDGNAIAVDTGRLLVGDLATEAVIAINSGTGNRTVLTASEEARIGTGPSLDNSSMPVFSGALNALFLRNWGADSEILRVDLSTGGRTVVADFDGVVFDELLIDEAGERLLALKGHVLTLTEIPLDGSDKTTLFTTDSSVAPFTFVNAAIMDAERNRIIYQMSGSDELRALSLDDFSTSVISGGSTGSGASLRPAGALALDAQRDRILSAATVPFELQSAAMASGDRSVLIASGANVAPQLYRVNTMVVAGDNGYLLDSAAGNIVRVDLGSLQRGIVGGDGTGSRAMFGVADGLVVRESEQLAWSFDTGVDALVVFDLTSGDHVIVSR